MQLVKYEAACRALAEAKSVDEVKEIFGVAEAARAYARQVKNKSLELDALEIRTRAERRLGEMLLQMRHDGKFGQGRGGSPIKLSDLGIDANISSPAQRLAKLPGERFESEIVEWRERAETSQRIEVPLQDVRVPTIRADREKVQARLGRTKVAPADPFDKYRAVDGRRIAGWRVGELDRIEQLALRMASVASALRSALPVANADPLETMEMVFQRAALQKLLDGEWHRPVDCGDAGLNGERIRKAREANRRICGQCSTPFVMKKGSTAGKFCSRACSEEFRRK